MAWRKAGSPPTKQARRLAPVRHGGQDAGGMATEQKAREQAARRCWLFKRVDRCAVLPQCSTWWNQKGSQGRGFVSGYEAGLRR
jgi:hypothetical protein